MNDNLALDPFLIRIIFMLAGAMGLLFLQAFWKTPTRKWLVIALGCIAVGMVLIPFALTLLKV